MTNANEPPADVAEIAARVEAAKAELDRVHKAACNGSKDIWRVSIPVNEKRDSDVLIGNGLYAVEETLSQLADWRTRALAAEAALKPFAETVLDEDVPFMSRPLLIPDHDHYSWSVKFLVDGELECESSLTFDDFKRAAEVLAARADEPTGGVNDV